MDRPKALVLDADSAVRALLREAFAAQGLDTVEAGSMTDARELLEREPFDLILADVQSWPRALDAAAARRPLIVGLGGEVEELDSEGLDVFDGLPKPLEPRRVRRLARRLRGVLELRATPTGTRADLAPRTQRLGIIGASAAVEGLRQQLEAAATSDEPLWLCGEPGVGKEHAARALHALAGQETGTFAMLASSSRNVEGPAGRLQQLTRDARDARATLYVEEPAALAPEAQRRLAGTLVDSPHRVRVVAASRRHPSESLAEGRLLGELWSPFAARTIEIPALRERVEDIPLLARHFLDRIAEANRLPPFELHTDTVHRLVRYRWPGNAEELRSAMEHAAILASENLVRPRDLPDTIGETVEGRTDTLSRRPFRPAKREVVAAFERAYLSDLMRRHGGNVTTAARESGMLRSALQRLLRKHTLKSREFRSATPWRDDPGADPPAEDRR